jgi:serine/threonine protein phosphatase PrpC
VNSATSETESGTLMQLPIEDRIRAVRWKLGLSTDGGTSEHLSQLWEKLARDPVKLKVIAADVARQLSKPLQAALQRKLLGQKLPDDDWADLLIAWVGRNEIARSPKIAESIRAALAPPVSSAAPPSPKGTGLFQGPTSPPKPSVPPTMTPPPTMPPTAPPPTASAWKHLPIPPSPAPYEESIAAPFPNPPTGFRGFGARVRGKKHKHDGTNCDDWFAFERTTDGWTVIAVADGAGSKKLSRVGAKVATSAAVTELRKLTVYMTPDGRVTKDDWAAALDPSNTTFPFDLETIRETLRSAMQEALASIRNEAVICAADAAFTASLGQPAELGDLSCTLLLAVMHEVTVDGKPLQLVIACQVGDGMIGVIHRDGRPFLLGSADSGAHAGETEFITSSGKTEPEYLNRKMDATIIDLQALLVMTDGVADDYFPADPHLARLWGDLVVNGIPDLNAPPALDGASSAAVAPEDGIESEVIERDPRTRVTLYSSAKIAERLGTTAEELVKRPADLWSTRRPIAGETPEERLRLWLDAYHVRGSFDDRTLVCIHREDLQ